MRYTTFSLLALSLTIGTTAAFAQNASFDLETEINYNTMDLSRYSDAPWSDRDTNVSVSVLTDLGVLQGNADGTYRAERSLNRAEFMTIAMRLLGEGSGSVNLNCFPDVRSSDWYAEAVCRAKAAGIVRGNVREGVPADQWRFEPARAVQFEEVVKVLAKLYALPVHENSSATWYAPFIAAAEAEGIIDMELVPGDIINRGEMARLTVAFLAESRGELSLLRAAQDGTMPSSSSSQSSQSSSSSSSMMSSSSSSVTGTYDPYPGDSVEAQIVLLGEVSAPIAGVQFFSNDEPISVEEISVELTSSANTIDALLIYDETGLFLGTATGNGTTFTTSVPDGRLTLPYRDEHTIYVRARLKAENSGGISGQIIQVDDITLRGTGDNTSNGYTTTSNETFIASESALARIDAVVNAGPANSILISGDDQVVGEFRFTDDSVGFHHPRLTDIDFTIYQSGNVTLSNVEIGTLDSSDRSACSISSSVITCSGIPVGIGTIDSSRTIRVFADVDVPGISVNPNLRLVINQSGSATAAGDMTWTDGTATFQWLPMATPVVGSTQFN